MKRKTLDAFSWFLIGCFLVIVLGILADAFKRATAHANHFTPPTRQFTQPIPAAGCC